MAYLTLLLVIHSALQCASRPHHTEEWDKAWIVHPTNGSTKQAIGEPFLLIDDNVQRSSLQSTAAYSNQAGHLYAYSDILHTAVQSFTGEEECSKLPAQDTITISLNRVSWNFTGGNVELMHDPLHPPHVCEGTLTCLKNFTGHAIWSCNGDRWGASVLIVPVLNETFIYRCTLKHSTNVQDPWNFCAAKYSKLSTVCLILLYVCVSLTILLCIVFRATLLDLIFAILIRLITCMLK
ncbi:ORF2 [Ranid herpesvirus 1]|uniref:ORF2 n=1 Tax=Ranid herpesvirus 1 TaxID=85655 RepID=Q14VV6_9VIRU|nr:ORF2 [Ranid herpesvirus 1]ABG25807.1 ORF2 [Ranid herpesvirus 1]